VIKTGIKAYVFTLLAFILVGLVLSSFYVLYLILNHYMRQEFAQAILLGVVSFIIIGGLLTLALREV